MKNWERIFKRKNVSLEEISNATSETKEKIERIFNKELSMTFEFSNHLRQLNLSELLPKVKR